MILLWITEIEMPIKCPATHPYAFKQGRNCCKTRKEDDHNSPPRFVRHPHRDETCDGGELSIYSNCCENEAFIRCSDGKLCIDSDDVDVAGGSFYM